MDRSALFEWLVGLRFSDSESERIVADWLVYAYAPRLEQTLAACLPLDEERFDLGTTGSAAPDARLPILTPSVKTVLASALVTLGFYRDPAKENVYSIMSPGDTDGKEHAEATAETLVALGRQMTVLDQVADAASALVTDYLHALQDNTPQRAAMDWLVGPFLDASETLDRTAGRRLPASVAAEARRTIASAPASVVKGQWLHVVIILSRLGYTTKRLRAKAPDAAPPAEVDGLEALVPPANAFGAQAVLSALHHLRREREHILREPQKAVPVQAPIVAPATTSHDLFALFGDCEAVRERKAIEARVASERALEQITDVSELVNVLAGVIADAEEHETLEDRRSLRIAAELSEVRRKLVDMEQQARVLEESNAELKRLGTSATTDLDRAQQRVTELERLAAQPRAPGTLPGVLPGPPPPPPMGGAPPPPPPPGMGPLRPRRIPVQPRAADDTGPAGTAKKPAPVLGFDVGEMLRRNEERKKRLEQAAAAGTEAAGRLETGAVDAGNVLNAAASQAVRNGTEKSPAIVAAEANPILAARIRERRAVTKAAPPPRDIETSSERLKRQIEERVVQRRRAVVGTPVTPAPPGSEWEHPLASLYGALAPLAFEPISRVYLF